MYTNIIKDDQIDYQRWRNKNVNKHYHRHYHQQNCWGFSSILSYHPESYSSTIVTKGDKNGILSYHPESYSSTIVTKGDKNGILGILINFVLSSRKL